MPKASFLNHMHQAMQKLQTDTYENLTLKLGFENLFCSEAKSHIPDEATTPKAKAKMVTVVDITPSKLDTITPTKVKQYQ